MQERSPTDILLKNISCLKQISDELNSIKNIKLNSLDFNLRRNNYFKKSTKKAVNSTLNIKVKKKNIEVVNFGLCINIGCDVLYDYLNGKHINSISLNFELKNISTEQNMLFYINSSNTKSPLSSFITQDFKSNSINLNEKINFIKNELYLNNKLSFFLPIFKSYDNYDDFFKAISNVTLTINYNE